MVSWLTGIVLGVVVTLAVIYWKNRQTHGFSLHQDSVRDWVRRSSFPVFLLEDDGSISALSPLAEKTLGEVRSLAGQNFLKLLRESERQALLDYMSGATKTLFCATLHLKARRRSKKGLRPARSFYLFLDRLHDGGQFLGVLIDRSPNERLARHFYTQLAINSSILELLDTGVILEENGKILLANSAFRKLFRLPQGLVMRQFMDCFPEQSIESLLKILQNEEITQDTTNQTEIELVRHNGSRFLCHVQIRAIKDNVDQHIARLWLFRDVSDQRLHERHLRQSAVVFESSNDAISIVDSDKRIKLVNSAFVRITGFSPEEVTGRKATLLGAGQNDIKRLEKIWKIAEQEGVWQGEVWKRRRDGSRYLEWMSVTAVKNAQGLIDVFVVIAHDMTERKQAEERIRYQANYDLLTKLPNRTLFMDRLRQGISRAARDQCMLAVLFIDLDRFKYVNDSFGHTVGDKMLVKVAEMLKGCVRRSDTISRFGGDEFAIILSPIYGAKNAERVAENILRKLSQPLDLDGYEAVAGGSIGISLFPDDGESAEQLVKNADSAMYRAKERGRNTYQFYTDEMQQSAQQRIMLERDLRAAFAERALELAFQPQLDCRTGQPGGLEVLMRWSNGEQGQIPPSIFIALAEDTGLIVPMGRWAIHEACAIARRWRDAGISVPTMAINVSPRQFKDKNLVTIVEQAIANTGIAPEMIELELTESMLMDDHDFAIYVLKQLKKIGVRLSIDDFGTGYSSLAYLKQFPVDAIKIDRSFVKEITQNESDASIVRAIINLGHTLDMHVVAEGVESQEQVDLLMSFGIDLIQGYVYARPMAESLCKQFLQQAKEHATP